MPTAMLTKDEYRVPQTLPPTFVGREAEEARAAARRQAKRVRRLKINAAVWAVGTILVTTLWAIVEWQDNGALESFGHEGNSGQWNPTLWALVVGVWSLIVGIMALQVYFERPPTAAELRPGARVQLERVRRLTFHVAAWALGMLVLTPIWALIEWQDNGAFERFGDASQPGEWEPWILYIGGIWALVVAIFAVTVYLRRPHAVES